MQYENSLALRTSLETGWRISDVLSLTPKQIKGRTVTITAMKTGKPDKKVVSADLAKRLKQISGREFVFEGRFGDKPRTRQAVWKDIKRSAKQLKLDGNISCHSARKTYAVEDFKDGGLAKVQKDLQHSDINTTMLYAFADLIDKQPACKTTGRITDKKPNNGKENYNNTSDDKKINEQQEYENSINNEAFAELVADKVAERLLPLLAQPFGQKTQ